jgi:hypothetical protein
MWKTGIQVFIDASHFVMGCDFLGYIYGKARRFIKTYSGRKRYNILEALNYDDFNIFKEKIDTIVNSTDKHNPINKNTFVKAENNCSHARCGEGEVAA